MIPDTARLLDDRDWEGCEAADISALGPPLKRFTWLSPSVLWQSRNNPLASLTGDPTENARRAWVHAQRERLRADGEPSSVAEDFTIERPDLQDFSFMLMGDTGEGDVSQYAVVPSFLALGKGTEFAVIASDVVYPAGDVNEYVNKFFAPYAGYPRPIYAVPGNHDWLDGLVGFMRHFCAAPPPAEKLLPPRHTRYPRSALLLHRLLWRRAGKLAPVTLGKAVALRGAAAASGPAQPNMYFCIDTPALRIICIDVGILGRLDAEQGEWLKRMATGPKAKLLISGAPIYSGTAISPRRILTPEGDPPHGLRPVPHARAGGGLLLNLLRDPAYNFVASISGDIHHYERYAVRQSDGRVLQFVISGGGGAFMTSTHQIPRVDLPGVTERDFVVFPARGDSLRAYSIVLQRRLRRVFPWLRRRPLRGIPADEAAAIVAERHGLDPEPGATPVSVSRRSRRLARLVYPRRAWFKPKRISEVLDWDEPPFFKNVMRLEVSDGVLRVTVYGVSGLRRDQDDPVAIDGFEVRLDQAAREPE